jgi:hypothetical protein
MPILDRIASFFATDVVAIYNASQEQVFAKAIPMKASINRQSQQFEHPLEDSTVITDHRVILPIEIQLSMTIPNGRYKDVYEQIASAFINGDLLEVRTKAATYTNMVIQAMPHDENAERFDAIDMIISLKETQFESVSIEVLPFNEVVRKDQSSSVDRGQQNPASTSSVASQIVDGVKELIQGFFK